MVFQRKDGVLMFGLHMLELGEKSSASIKICLRYTMPMIMECIRYDTKRLS